MKVINIVDLHCDTLYKAVTQNLDFSDDSLEVSLKVPFGLSLQCYAIWIPDNLKISKARELFDKAYLKLENECKKNKICLINSLKEIKTAFYTNNQLAVFTVENCSLLDGDISGIKYLAEHGIKIATLTWNGHNCIGDGADVTGGKGITDFGKKAISEFERNGVIIDVSHSSDSLFYEVASLSKRPFIATHSNSRAVANHRRNLTDEQFNAICSSGGIVGLNFHRDFLNAVPDNASIYDVLRHTEHFLSLNGENNISIGSDFDGCTLPDDIEGNKSLYDMRELFLKHNYSEKLVNKIFYENALNFFENFDI